MRKKLINLQEFSNYLGFKAETPFSRAKKYYQKTIDRNLRSKSRQPQ